MIYELITLKPLFAAKTESRLVDEICRVDLEDKLNGFPVEFKLMKELIRNSLVVDYSHRFTLDLIE